MSERRAPAVVATGEVMVELAGAKPLARAEMIKRSNSGDVLNVAVVLGRLGLPCSILTKVGDDPFGDYLLEDWTSLGVDLRYVTRGGGPTGLYVAEHAADASYQIWYWRKGSAASTIAPADVDRVDLDGVRLVHLSGISQAISASSARRDAAPGAVRAATAASRFRWMSTTARNCGCRKRRPRRCTRCCRMRTSCSAAPPTNRRP